MTEISNETVYSTKDLKRLWDMTWEAALREKRSVDEQIANEQTQSWRRVSLTEHSEVMIGYYNPGPSAGWSKTYDGEKLPQYVSNKKGVISRHRRSDGTTSILARIGIVKASKFARSPLEQLAVVAQDVMTVPTEVVRQIVCAFWNIMGLGYDLDLNSVKLEEPQWSWVAEEQVSYTLRVKRGVAAKAKRKAAINRTAKQFAQLVRADCEVRRFKLHLLELIKNQEDRIERYDSACNKLSITPKSTEHFRRYALR